jgi:hypothetical protein
MSHCPICESKLPMTGGKPRSYDQHKRFFAVIRAAFEHWPERDKFSDEVEFRKYLQVMVGAGEVVAEIPVAGLGKEIAKFIAMQAIKASGGYAVPVIRGDNLRIVKPKSVAFDKMKHEEFCKVSDRVCAYIETVLHVSADDLIRETEAAA